MDRAFARFAFFLLVLGIGQNAALCSAASLNNEWTVESAAGTVTVEDRSATPRALLPIRTGMRLTAPFAVRTGIDGSVALSHGQDKLVVRPNSAATIPMAAASGDGVATRIAQSLGVVFYQVQHRIKDRFEVETPYLVAVVKGTTFNILVADHASTVALLEGRVLVHTPDMKAQATLEPGQTATKSRQGDGILLKDQKTLSLPAPGPISIALGDTAGSPVTGLDTALAIPEAIGGYVGLSGNPLSTPDLGGVGVGTTTVLAPVGGVAGAGSLGAGTSGMSATAGVGTGGVGNVAGVGGVGAGSVGINVAGSTSVTGGVGASVEVPVAPLIGGLPLGL